MVNSSSVTISNMNGGIKAPWVIQGCKVDWAAVSGIPSRCSPIASVCSLHDKAVFAVSSDVGCFSKN